MRNRRFRWKTAQDEEVSQKKAVSSSLRHHDNDDEALGLFTLR
jgi:hypothetical protein